MCIALHLSLYATASSENSRTESKWLLSPKIFSTYGSVLVEQHQGGFIWTAPQGNGRHQPTMKKGVAGSGKSGKSEHFASCSRTGHPASSSHLPVGRKHNTISESTAPTATSSSVRGCSPSSTGRSKRQQTECLHSFCSES